MLTRHDDARSVGKISLLGEFGLLDTSIRNRVYQEWLEVIENGLGNGALLEVDLRSLNCMGGEPDFSQASAVFLRFNPCTFHIDNVRFQ